MSDDTSRTQGGATASTGRGQGRGQPPLTMTPHRTAVELKQWHAKLEAFHKKQAMVAVLIGFMMVEKSQTKFAASAGFVASLPIIAYVQTLLTLIYIRVNKSALVFVIQVVHGVASVVAIGAVVLGMMCVGIVKFEDFPIGYQGSEAIEPFTMFVNFFGFVSSFLALHISNEFRIAKDDETRSYQLSAKNK